MEHELKYLLPPRLTATAAAAVSALCRPDPRYPVGIVMSLYFDNNRLDSLAEKVDSQLAKAKVRVRWYRNVDGTVDPGGAMLEHKTRLGTLRRKARVRLPHSPRWLDRTPLEDPRLVALPSHFLDAEEVTRSGLFPYLIVRYLRRRFVEPFTGSRIAVDTAISVHRVNRRFLGYVHPAAVGPTVLEVKNREGTLPSRLACLLRLGARLDSFSKYEVCFRAALAPRLGSVEA